MKKITVLIALMIVSLGFSQVPGTAAPTPPARVATDVISVYSDAYTPLAGVDLNPNWGQTTVESEITIAGNKTLQYANLGYQGTEWSKAPGSAQNISNMEYLHVDVWTNNQAPNVYVITSTGDGTAHHISSVAGSWQSLDIPIASFTGTLTNAIQFKFDGGTGGTIYLDNLYFWKTAAPTGTPVIGFLTLPAFKFVGDASFTLTDPTSTSAGAFSYTSSNTAVATVSGHTVTIVGAGTTTFTANQAASGSFLAGSVTANLEVDTAPLVAAPTPPTRNSWDVISLYSNAYNNRTVDTWSASWDNSNIYDVQIAGNDTKYIKFGTFLGVDFSGAGHHIDATAMTNFHMDLWVADANQVGLVCNPKFVDFGGTANEVSHLLFPIELYPSQPSGTWISIDLPFTAVEPSSTQTRSDLAQLVITSVAFVAVPGQNVFVDNVYMYRPATLGTTSFETSNVKLYPNPVTNTLNIDANSAIQKVSIYNVLGQEVLKSSPNSNSATLQTSGLKRGVYMVQTLIDGKVSTSKVVKE